MSLIVRRSGLFCFYPVFSSRLGCSDGHYSISDIARRLTDVIHLSCYNILEKRKRNIPWTASIIVTDMDTVDAAEPRHHHHHHHSQPQPRRRNPVKTGTWLPVEDVRLREAVAKYGAQWVRVAGEVGTRNGDQCAKRWNENLNPELDHGPWTPEEVSLSWFQLN